MNGVELMTHVQTEVPEDEYERLRSLAEERGLSLREALRQAAELWIETQEAVDPDDALFTSVDTVREASGRGREATTATTEDDLIEEWEGDADEHRVPEPN